MAWRALLNTSSGWVNYLFSLVGPPQPNWLASPHTAMPSVLLADVWSGAPTVAIIVLAGLLALQKDPVEAARVDGATDWQIFPRITLPALRPVLAFAAAFRLVDLFRQIALFQAVTGGGPGLATTVLNFFVYQTTFVFGELGYGAALAVLLIVMMIIPLAVFARLPAGAPNGQHRQLQPRLAPTAAGRAVPRHRRPGHRAAVHPAAHLRLLETAFQKPRDAFTIPPHFIFLPTLENFRSLIQGQFAGSLLHSVILMAWSTAVALLLGVRPYALSRSRFRGSLAITAWLIGAYITPAFTASCRCT